MPSQKKKTPLLPPKGAGQGGAAKIDAISANKQPDSKTAVRATKPVAARTKSKQPLPPLAQKQSAVKQSAVKQSAVKQPAVQASVKTTAAVNDRDNTNANVIVTAHTQADQKTNAKSASKVKAKAKAKAQDSSIVLLQLTAKGQKTTDKSLTAYQPGQGGLPFAELLDGLCMAQRDPALQTSQVWGLLTPDFTKRTGLTGQDLRSTIQSNPGYDLYYASAHPELEALYHNPWRSPVVTHPEFVALSRRFLKAAGLSDVPVDAISHSSLFATGHLMVASPAFWEKYVGFVETVFRQVQKNLTAVDQEKLFKEPPVTGRMSHLSLIVARLMSVFLMLKNSKFRAYKIPLPEQEKAMNSHLRLLREMKDLGLQEKSKWHLAAWVNYRGLYLAHVMGKAWILEHIQPITPTDLHATVPIAEVRNPYTTSMQVA